MKKVYAQNLTPPNDKGKTLQMPVNQIEREEIFQEEDPYVGLERATKLEHDYIKSGLDYGDRLRIIDDSGNLYDVIMMPDGTVGVQNLTLRIEYGQMTKYNTWEDADAALPEYSMEQAIVAHRIAKLLNKTENPYIK